MNSPDEVKLAADGNVDTSQISSKTRLSKADWMNLAIDVLVNEGIDHVKAHSLAKRMGVARSSLFWFFPRIQDLYDEILSHWLTRNTGPIIERAMRPAPTVTRAVCNVFECWVDRELFDPSLDIGIRLWARTDPHVRGIVEQADNQRVDALAKMFQRYGIEEEEAFTRARVLYFTQVGHYTLEVKDSMSMRLTHLRSYLLAFTGKEPSAEELATFEKFSTRYEKPSR